MNEASGCGFYLGPDEQLASNKTVYGNAVWQPLNLLKPTRNAQHATRKKRCSCRPKAKGKSAVCAELTGVSLRIS